MKPLKALNIKEHKDITKTVRAARKAEKTGQLDLRDGFATEVFNTPNARLITDGDRVVDTFWDIKTQSFITQVRVGGKEVMPSVYSKKAQAPVSHLWALYTFMKRDVA